jgi:putative lipoic acid-binding regulatory protein
MENGEDPVRRALDLLLSAHTFPGPFELRVVAAPSAREPILEAVRNHVGPDGVIGVTERPSRTGAWLAVRVTVLAQTPDTVLELYAIVRAVEGVQAVL